MERVTAEEAVLAYYRAAIRRAGGKVAQLLRALEPEAPGLVRRTATWWSNEGGGRHIPAYVLLAIWRTWPDLSLDGAAGVTERPASLERQVAELRELVHDTRRLLDELAEGLDEVRERVELPALEYPNRDLGTSGVSSH